MWILSPTKPTERWRWARVESRWTQISLLEQTKWIDGSHRLTQSERSMRKGIVSLAKVKIWSLVEDELHWNLQCEVSACWCCWFENFSRILFLQIFYPTYGQTRLDDSLSSWSHQFSSPLPLPLPRPLPLSMNS
jgi:hypothetical protein